MKIHKSMYRPALAIFLCCVFLFSCKEKCIKCTVTWKSSQKVMETRTACDKSKKYLQGFEDGVKARWDVVKDSVDVVCE